MLSNVVKEIELLSKPPYARSVARTQSCPPRQMEQSQRDIKRSTMRHLKRDPKSQILNQLPNDLSG
jgi:hypothetical protein